MPLSQSPLPPQHDSSGRGASYECHRVLGACQQWLAGWKGHELQQTFLPQRDRQQGSSTCRQAFSSSSSSLQLPLSAWGSQNFTWRLSTGCVHLIIDHATLCISADILCTESAIQRDSVATVIGLFSSHEELVRTATSLSLHPMYVP